MMLAKHYRVTVTAFILLFAFTSHASACSSSAECAEWAVKNCACGVPATCIGITAQNSNGSCQCYGAQGSCKSSSDNDTANDPTVIYNTPHRRRAAPVKRNTVRKNQGIESVEIEKTR
jgi:hypothetical protein